MVSIAGARAKARHEARMAIREAKKRGQEVNRAQIMREVNERAKEELHKPKTREEAVGDFVRAYAKAFQGNVSNLHQAVLGSVVNKLQQLKPAPIQQKPSPLSSRVFDKVRSLVEGPKVSIGDVVKEIPETARSFARPFVQPMKESAAIGADIALRLSPLEAARNLYAGVKSAMQGKGFQQGVLQDQVRQLLYEKVAGTDITKPGETKKAIGRAMELPTYLYGGGEAFSSKLAGGWLSRTAQRAVKNLPLAATLTAIQGVEKDKPIGDVLKELPGDFLSNEAGLTAFSTLFGELGRYKAENGSLPVGLSTQDITSKLKPKEVPISKLKSIAGDRERALADFKAGKKSKTNLPVLVKAEKDGTYTVLDGNGRIVEAQADGKKTIKITTNEAEYRKLTEDVSKKSQLPQEGEIKASGLNLEKADEFLKPRGYEARIKKMPETPEQLGIRLGTEYTPRSREELYIKAKNLVRDDLATAEKIARTRVDDMGVAVGNEVANHYIAKAQKATDEATANALWEKAANVIKTNSANLTEAGRAVEAAKQWGKMTPEGFLRFANAQIEKYNEGARLAKKIPSLSGDQVKEFTDLFNRFKVATGEEKAQLFKQIHDKLGNLMPSDLVKQIATVWKAGLLTAPTTTGVNLGSNITKYLVRQVEKIPASIADMAMSVFTKRRAFVATTRGEARGVAEGLSKAKTYLKTGFDTRDVAAKWDMGRVYFGDSRAGKVANAYTQYIFRFLGAQDPPFYYAAYQNSMMSQALAEAKNAKVSNVEEFVKNFINNPSDEALKTAVADAGTAVFQNETWLGRAAQSIQRLPVVGQFIAPFTRTPGAVATQILDYSPVGVGKEIISQIIEGKFNQRKMSQAIGRSTVGTTLLGIGAYLYKTGRLNLGREQGKETAIQKAEGKMPNAVKIGDKWRSVYALGPMGAALLMGGYFKKTYDETKDKAKATTAAMFGGLKWLTEQSFLTGLSTWSEAVMQPEKKGIAVAKSLAGSIVPRLIGKIAEGMDGWQRMSENSVAGIGQAFKATVPGWREKLAKVRDIFGQPVGGKGFWETLLDPTRPARSQDNEVTAELRRLQDILPQDQVPIPSPYGSSIRIKVNGAWENKELSTDLQSKLQESAGITTLDGMRMIMGSSYYHSLPDEDKAKFLKDIITYAKDQAEHQILGAELNTQLKSPEEVLTQVKATALFNEVKKLDSEGKYDQSDEIINSLNDKEYAEFEKVDKAWKTKNSTEFGKLMEKKDVEGMARFLDKLDVEEQDRLIENMDKRINKDETITDDQVDAFDKAVKMLEEGKISEETKKELSKVVPEGKGATPEEEANARKMAMFAEIEKLPEEQQAEAYAKMKEQFPELAPTATLASVNIGKGAAVENNNPLNIKIGKATQHWIDEGLAVPGSMAKDGGQFLKFKTPEIGKRAAEELLFKSGVYSNLTVEQAARKWSNKGYGAEATGVAGNKMMKNLTEDEKKTMLGAMAWRESSTTFGDKLASNPPRLNSKEQSVVSAVASGKMTAQKAKNIITTAFDNKVNTKKDPKLTKAVEKLKLIPPVVPYSNIGYIPPKKMYDVFSVYGLIAALKVLQNYYKTPDLTLI